MDIHEAMRDAFFALFGLIVLLYIAIGVLGIEGIRRLHSGRPPLGHRPNSPGEDVLATMGRAAEAIWRRAVAWSDVGAGMAGVLSASLAIPVAIALPVSDRFFTPIDRGAVLVGVGFALSAAGSVLGRCIAITRTTVPLVTVGNARASGARRQLTRLATALWAVDAVVSLLVAVGLATTTQTPPAQEYIVPAYIALVLLFPTLLGMGLAAEIRLVRRWQSLARSILSATPSLPGSIADRLRPFADTVVTGRTMAVGFLVMMGQSLLVAQIASYEPYFGGWLIAIAAVCAYVASITGLLTLMAHVIVFTRLRGEEAPAVTGGLPTS